MSEATPTPKRFSLLRVVVIALVGAAAAGGYYAYVVSTEGTVNDIDIMPSLREFGKRLGEQEKLAAAYTDRNGDKLADVPTDPAKFINPNELAFTVVVNDDPEEAEKTWQPVMEHLAKATGRPVKYLKRVSAAPGLTDADGKPIESEALRGTEQQIAAVRDGRLHITAFNTGAVPLAVNAGGFHPLFAPADEAGKYAYQMQVIVPGNSQIAKLEDLKGKTLGFVALSSNSGARAPMVLLSEEAKLLPGRDYHYVLTGRHERSVLELAGGKSEPNFQAACVASDILQQMMDDQRVDASRVKAIFSSASFPKLTFGVPHNLDPDLRKKIVDGFASYRFPKNTEKQAKFAAIEYSKAFADVLATDEKLIALLGGKQ